LVNLSPRRHKPLLPGRKLATNHFDSVHGKDADGFLVVRVKMRTRMWCTSFDEHSDHDPEEAADLRHACQGSNRQLDRQSPTI